MNPAKRQAQVLYVSGEVEDLDLDEARPGADCGLPLLAVPRRAPDAAASAAPLDASPAPSAAAAAAARVASYRSAAPPTLPRLVWA